MVFNVEFWKKMLNFMWFLLNAYLFTYIFFSFYKFFWLVNFACVIVVLCKKNCSVCFWSFSCRQINTINRYAFSKRKCVPIQFFPLFTISFDCYCSKAFIIHAKNIIIWHRSKIKSRSILFMRIFFLWNFYCLVLFINWPYKYN